MATDTLNGRNIVFPIYNEDGTPFHNLVLRKSVVDSVVMSLGDKITGDVYYKDNTLAVTMQEYIEYKQNPDDENEEPIRYSLVNPPTIVREGMVADNGELKGMTKYSFEFYHPMCQLSNFPFTDVATKTGEEKYLSQNKSFSWIGKPQDYIDKLNKNLQGTVWYVRKSDRFPIEKNNELSDVLTFDNVTVADAIKTGYETWDIPYVVGQLQSTDPLYAQGKRFVVEYGLPSNEIYESDSARQLDSPFVFHMGQGVGLKNNSRTPRNNKIVTRIAGYGSEDNVPYGYPQIVWTGNQDWDYTVNNDSTAANSYPIYKGIVGGQYVKLIKHPFTRTHLMPSIYTETVNKKVNPNAVGYNPNIEIKDYYDAIATQEYPYTNEINPQAPSYESHEFADIKPEFDSESSIGIISAIPLNSDLTPADHWDDSMDDDGNYLQSYFQITLPQLNFDLYACAAITQEMQINMRSGDCIGCTFPIQVDWDDYKRNFYDEDGNFVPDGEQRDLTKYPKSNLGQISVVVQKDNSTFGTLMPNIYQQPKSDDLFVFIGISLPTSYITNAEIRLDAAMKSYMLENNVYYFDYPLKFDEHFLATHTYILEQIRPNSIIHFDYGGVEQQLFVKQLTVKYGNAPLPQYDITLTDNVEVVLNQIGQVADDVEKLSSLIAILRQSYNRNVWIELAKKLSKTQDDTAQGYIRFIKGLQVGSNFVPDILGEGGVLRMRDDGKVELVTDILYARVKAYFDTVEIREYKHTAGNRIASVAGNKCVRVAWFNSSNVELEQTQANLSSVAYFRCFFRASDGEDTVRNNFSIGDQAYCHVTSIATGSDNPEEKGLNQKHFWRLVIGRNTEGTLTEDGEAYIDLSNRATETIGGVSYEGYQSGSDVPQPQDDIIQLGNVNDATRQGAIVEYVTGTDAPSYQIYQGINSFSLNGKNQIGFGYNTATGRAYMNVYGDFRFGSRNNNGSYIKYNSQTGNLEIKAHVEFTNSDAELDTLVQEHQRDDSYDDSWIQPAINELQDQIDGAIETYYMVGEPALNLPPVISTQEHPYDEPWLDGTETQEERTKILNNHIGDLYYDKDTGHGYRFLYDDSSRSFVWVWLTDEDIEAALEAANNAQATADGKMTIYSIWGAWVKESVNTLKVGDLFIPANDTTQGGNTYYARKVYKCTVAGQNSFSEINYTDDSALNTFKANQYVQQLTNGTITTNITNAQNAANNAQGAADAAQSTADGAASAAAALGYLSQALGQNTEVVGGLVLSTLIALRDSSNNTWSGINGAYQQSETGTGYKGHGIAAWYGGAMVDKEVVTTATDYAKSLFRFDGSGYLASGNITWDKNGIVTITNVYSNIDGVNVPWSATTMQYMNNLVNILPITYVSSVAYFDPKLSFTNLSIGGNAVATQQWVTTQIGTLEYLNQASGEDGVLLLTTNKGNATLIDLTHEHSWFEIQDRPTTLKGLGISADDELLMNNYISIAFFRRLFQAYNGNAEVLPNDTASAIDNIKAMFGFWTEQYISALGQSSGGGGGVGDVTWELLADNTDTRQIALSHLTTALTYYATQSWVTTQIGTLEYLNQASGEDGVLLLTTNKGNTTLIDLTHEHSWFEIQDRPTTLVAYGITSNDELLNTVLNTALSGYLPLTGGTITGGLTVNGGITASGITTSGNITAAMFVRSGGTASQFLKADGSVDNTAYTTNVGTVTSVGTGTGLTGGTITVSGTISINSEYQGYISNGNTAYGWGNHATFGYATVAQLNALEFLNQVSGGDGLVMLTTNKSNSTVLDLTHQHSWFEIQDRPTTILGYGITDGVFTGSVTIGSNELNTNYRLTVNGNTRTNRLYLTDSVYLEYDSSNSGIHVVGAGLYSDTYISALGASTGTAGGVGDVTWDALASSSDTRQIAASHLTNVLSNYLSKNGGTITGNLTVGGINGSLKFGTDNFMRIKKDNYRLLIVNEAGDDIIIGDYDNRNNTSIVNDLQGCTVSSAYTVGTTTWFIFNDGTAQFKSVTQTSDLRKKTIIGDVPINLYNVANAPLFKFTWKDEKKYSGQHIGSAAQYWQTVLPELVTIGRDTEQTLAMQYDVIALASVITVAKTVVSHEERIKILENENKALRHELEKLRESA